MQKAISIDKKLVIFDFDGVLIETLLVCHSIASEVNEDLSVEEYRGFFNGNIYKAIRKNNEPRAYHPDFEEKYFNKTRELKIPIELKSILEKLSSNHKLVIVSSTPSHLIKKILERENCLEYFDDIYGADIHTSKVVKINNLLEKYNTKPDETIFITDTVGDILEARECSVESIAVTWGFHDKETLSKAGPKFVIDNPDDLI